MTPVQADALRLGLFLGLGALLLALEAWRPLRASGGAYRRWDNLGLMVAGALVVRALLPFLPVAWAGASQGIFPGLLGLLDAPGWLEGLLAFVVLDAAVFAQHRAMHAHPWLWRLHRVHHLDTGFDVSTGVRFHPLELLTSMGWKLAVITLLGPDPRWVLAYEAALSSFALLTHANVALPAWLDRRLRRVVATPSMHRIHHSVHRDETDSNFASLLSVWDRLSGTYRDAPRDDEVAMVLGLPGIDSQHAPRLKRLLAMPFHPLPPEDAPK
jgi:sterol desaturase/sphingolipid hydroxylase (fatty acid hydroxylase superfamily)